MPTTSWIALAAAATEARSIKSSWTPINLSSSADAPVAVRSNGIAVSGSRMAATTRHPSR
ncbi:hypothetical protein A5693_19905 [Mycobacterium sp. E1319]|nr:hypothetical protein A5693_19905 [Mycobacterium sp. E1319]